MPRFANISEYHRGWFIGDFEPSLERLKTFEACYTSHKRDETSDPHYHTSSTEINLVISGKLLVNGKLLEEGGIFIYDKNEVSDVQFVEDTKLLIIRIPSAPNDKVIVSRE
jgi:hypothetical protein